MVFVNKNDMKVFVRLAKHVLNKILGWSYLSQIAIKLS